MRNNAGERDTLSSEKRGYRKMLKAKRKYSASGEQMPEIVSSTTCPRKANPHTFRLDL
jgi:hypothetical protein